MRQLCVCVTLSRVALLTEAEYAGLYDYMQSMLSLEAINEEVTKVNSILQHRSHSETSSLLHTFNSMGFLFLWLINKYFCKSRRGCTCTEFSKKQQTAWINCHRLGPWELFLYLPASLVTQKIYQAMSQIKTIASQFFCTTSHAISRKTLQAVKTLWFASVSTYSHCLLARNAGYHIIWVQKVQSSCVMGVQLYWLNQHS